MSLVFSSECSAAWLAHLVWDQGVGGSNPLTPTMLFKNTNYKILMVGLAQSVRASGCGSEGRRFDSGYLPH